MMAWHQYHETNNPFWPWMVLIIYGHARLLPPSWVWEYFLTAAICVGKGAAELRPFDEQQDKAVRYSTDKYIEVLGLTMSGGQRDHFTEFRRVITDFRLALRVRNLAFPETGEKTGLMEACRVVAEGARTATGRLTKSERDAEVKQVWKAHRRWFGKDGRFRSSPAPTQPH